MSTPLPERFKSLDNPASGYLSPPEDARRLRSSASSVERSRERLEEAVLAAFDRRKQRQAAKGELMAAIAKRKGWK